jgi:hypothetical protein
MLSKNTLFQMAFAVGRSFFVLFLARRPQPGGEHHARITMRLTQATRNCAAVGA